MVVPTVQPAARLSHLIGRLSAGNMAYLAGQFTVFVALAHLVPTSEVGRFSWALALTSPIFTLADMRTQQVQMTTAPSQYGYRVFAWQRVLAQLAAAIVSVALGIVSAPDTPTLSTVCAVTVLKTVEGSLNVVMGEHLRREAMGFVAGLQVVRSAVYVAAFVSAVALTLRADFAAAAAAGALLIPLAAGHLAIPQPLRATSGGWHDLIRLSKESLPLGIGFFIGSVTVNAPRFILERYHGVDSLAVFAAVSYAVIVANTIVDSITQGIMPRFSKYWRQNLHDHLLRVTRRLCLGVSALGSLGVITAVVAGGPLLSLLFGEAYRGGAPVLIVLMFSATLQYVTSVLRAVLIAQGMRRGVLWVSAVNMAVALTIALLTVPALGAIAAAGSLLAGQLIQSSTYLVLFGRVVKHQNQGAS